MKRITIKDVRPALERYAEACKDAGLIPEGMRIGMDEGSQTYGRAWRVYLTGIMVKDENGHPTFPKGSGFFNPPVGDDYLGWTAAEALAALQDRTTGIWAGLKDRKPSPAVTEAILRETLKSMEWVLSTSFGRSMPAQCAFRENVDDLRRVVESLR